MIRALFTSMFARLPLLTLACESLVLSVRPGQAAEWQPAHTTNGQLVIQAGLPLAVVSGNAAEIGSAEGELFKPRMAALLGLMSLQPRLLVARQGATFTATIAAIAEDDRSRLTALATTAGITPRTLIEANALVDAQCSAVVALPATNLPNGGDRPLRVARNMDFFPAAALGPGTVLEVIRLTGKRPYATIGWPGSAAVISGMNDAGLVACILLNHDGDALPAGEPLGLRLAHILQEDATVEAAVQRFNATPVASSHYVLLADALSATVVWRGRDGLHQDVPQGGWLTATNGRRAQTQPQDERGICLRNLCTTTAVPDAAWMRQVLTASYMIGINAQSMVFEPATCTVELAVGTAQHPAAKATWWRLSLTTLFAGGDADAAVVEQLPASLPLPHYTR